MTQKQTQNRRRNREQKAVEPVAVETLRDLAPVEPVALEVSASAPVASEQADAREGMPAQEREDVSACASGHDAPAREPAHEDTGGGGGPTCAGGESPIIHSLGGDFDLKGDSSPEKKSSETPAAPPPPEGPAAAQGDCAAPPEGESPPVASDGKEHDLLANVPPVPAKPNRRKLVVFRECTNPMVVLAKENPADPNEKPVTVIQARAGKLRVKMSIFVVPTATDMWKQVLV